MHPIPKVIVFDVNETLSDMSTIAERFRAVGVPGHLAKLWFAHLLRDGFALVATGDNVEFAEVGASVLRALLTDVPLDRDLESAVSHVMDGMADLDVHSDVGPGVRSLTAAGFRVVTLSNGAAQVAERLFARAELRSEFDLLLSVADAETWKPGRSAYEHAAAACGVGVEEMMLVAVHPWDLHGAAAAGMSTGWVNRVGASWPSYFQAPDITAGSLEELADVLNGQRDPTS